MRLVGQKHVPDDTSALNSGSVTAPHFCAQYPALSDDMLGLLQLAASSALLRPTAERESRSSTPADALDGVTAVEDVTTDLTTFNGAAANIATLDGDSRFDVVTLFDGATAVDVTAIAASSPNTRVSGEIAETYEPISDGAAPIIGSATCRSDAASSHQNRTLKDKSVEPLILFSSNATVSNNVSKMTVDACEQGPYSYITHSFVSDVELASAVMPVLCLLSRLSPGLQIEDQKLENVLGNFQRVLQSLLSSTVSNIRALAAASLVSLTPSTQQGQLVKELLHSVQISRRTNEKNGCLLAIKICIERSFNSEPINIFDRQDVVICMTDVFRSPSQCFSNRSLSCDILLLLEHTQAAIHISLEKLQCFSHHPGYFQFIDNVVRYCLLKEEGSEREELLIHCLEQGCVETMIVAVQFLKETSLQAVSKVTLLALLWKSVLNNKSCNDTLLHHSDLLCYILEKDDLQSLNYCSVQKEEDYGNFYCILRGDYDASVQRNGLILFAYLITQHNTNIPSTLMDLFTDKLMAFADEHLTEEFRICSCKALCVLLPGILQSSISMPRLKKSIVSLCLNFMSDEDQDIRSLASTLFIRKPLVSVPMHPNKSIALFLKIVCDRICDNKDLDLLCSLLSCSRQLSCIPAVNSGDVSLFKCDTRNQYKEPLQLGCIIDTCIAWLMNNGTDLLKQQIVKL